jgi:hypothetical protein
MLLGGTGNVVGKYVENKIGGEDTTRSQVLTGMISGVIGGGLGFAAGGVLSKMSPEARELTNKIIATRNDLLQNNLGNLVSNSELREQLTQKIIGLIGVGDGLGELVDTLLGEGMERVIPDNNSSPDKFK